MQRGEWGRTLKRVRWIGQLCQSLERDTHVHGTLAELCSSAKALVQCRFIYTDRFGRHGGVAIQQQNGLFGGDTHKYERDFSPRGGYNDVNHFTILDFEIAKIARFNFSIA